MIKWLFFFIVLFTSLFSQEWINISPFDDNSAIYGNFISENEGWIKKDYHYVPQEIYHTEDGGESWNLIYTLEDTLEHFLYFQMFDSSTGWAKTVWQNDHYPHNHYNRYIKTSDGGYTWVEMTEYLPDGNYFEPYYFFNNEEGLLGAGYNFDTHSTNIYKTVDGGFNWYLTETPIISWQSAIINYSPYKFFFLDDNVGWAACWAADGSCGVVISTIDGGESWEYVLGSFIPAIKDISFINPNLGGVACYAGTYNYVAITNDNFETLLYEYDYSDFNQIVHSICFQDESTIWITGDPGIINRSTNGGASFEEFQSFGSQLNQIQFFGDFGYIFGNNNKLLKYDSTNFINVQTLVDVFSLNVFPNPFNPTLTINFSAINESKLTCEIYNSLGQKIKTFDRTTLNTGDFTIIWDGLDENGNQVSSGLYIVNLISNNEILVSKKCVLIK